jgi:hypothetical protein
MAEPDQGWAFPAARSPKAHYFAANKVSLCGAWHSDGLSLFEDLTTADLHSHDDCKRCRRLLNARGVVR